MAPAVHTAARASQPAAVSWKAGWPAAGQRSCGDGGKGRGRCASEAAGSEEVATTVFMTCRRAIANAFRGQASVACVGEGSAANYGAGASGTRVAGAGGVGAEAASCGDFQR